MVIGVECGILAHHGFFDGELDGIAYGRVGQTLSADIHVWSYLIMLKYGINNIKLLYQSDMRVLDQINDD